MRGTQTHFLRIAACLAWLAVAVFSAGAPPEPGEVGQVCERDDPRSGNPLQLLQDVVSEDLQDDPDYDHGPIATHAPDAFAATPDQPSTQRPDRRNADAPSRRAPTFAARAPPLS